MYRLDNIHPLFVHFPIALFATGYLFDLLGYFLKQKKFLVVGWYNLALGVLAVPFTVATGFLTDTQYGHMQEPFPIYSSHGSLMILAGLMFIGLFARRFKHQPELPGKENLKLFYLIAQGLALVIIFFSSHLGAVLGDRL